VTPARGHGIGPNLAGVFGRRVGSAPGFDYSDALREAGFFWTPAELDRWLADPRSTLQGTRMNFRPLRDPGERADLIKWLHAATAPGLRGGTTPDPDEKAPGGGPFLLANANPAGLDDPQPPCWCFGVQQGEGSTQRLQCAIDTLSLGPQHPDSGVAPRGIPADVGEVEVQRDEDAVLAGAGGDQVGVGGTFEAFLFDGVCIVTGIGQQTHGHSRQVLVELEAEAHRQASGSGDADDPLAGQVGRVGNGGGNVLGPQGGVLV
jgi:hypothetical protein